MEASRHVSPGLRVGADRGWQRPRRPDLSLQRFFEGPSRSSEPSLTRQERREIVPTAVQQAQPATRTRATGRASGIPRKVGNRSFPTTERSTTGGPKKTLGGLGVEHVMIEERSPLVLDGDRESHSLSRQAVVPPASRDLDWSGRQRSLRAGGAVATRLGWRGERGRTSSGPRPTRLARLMRPSTGEAAASGVGVRVETDPG